MVTSKPLFLSNWKGLISMPTFTKFVASARGVSGMADYLLEVCFRLKLYLTVNNSCA